MVNKLVTCFDCRKITNERRAAAKHRAKFDDPNKPPPLCLSCNERPSKPSSRYCSPCRKRLWGARRPPRSELSEEERRKGNCRSYTKMLVKRGHLKRLPCANCGSDKSEAHHPDYRRPMIVIWLCREHHSLLHQTERFVKKYLLGGQPGADKQEHVPHETPQGVNEAHATPVTQPVTTLRSGNEAHARTTTIGKGGRR